MLQEAGGIGAVIVDMEGLDLEAIYQARVMVDTYEKKQEQAAAATAAAAAGAAAVEEGGDDSQPQPPPQQQEQQQEQAPGRNPVYTQWQVGALFLVFRTIECERPASHSSG